MKKQAAKRTTAGEERRNGPQRKAQKRRKSAGSLMWKFMQVLPFPLRAKLIRLLMPIPYTVDDSIIFKRAETYDEIVQALTIVYQGYKELGIVSDNASRMRITKYHALPTTATLIAVQKGEVIATMSVVMDSALGLPLEELWSVEHLRKKSRRMAEVSSLAIKRGFRSQRGRILLPLCNFMYNYAKKYMGVDVLLTAVHPMVKDFYRAMFLFQPLDNKVHKYRFAQGAAACAQYLKIDGSEEKAWEEAYGSEKPQLNMHHYLVTGESRPEFRFPQQPYYMAMNIALKPEQLLHLFKNCSTVLADLNDRERAILNNIYFVKAYKSVIGDSKLDELMKKRSSPRFTVMAKCKVRTSSKSEIFPGEILEVSSGGLKLQLHKGFAVNVKNNIHVLAHLGPKRNVSLICRPLWVSTVNNQVGVEIINMTSAIWSEYIQYLESGLHVQKDELVKAPLTKLKGA